MNTERRDGWVRALLTLLTLLGLATVAIPFFLTPPAALKLELEDTAFEIPMIAKEARVVDLENGKEILLPLIESPKGGRLVVPRIRSGAGHFEVAVEGFEPKSFEIQAEPLKTVVKTLPLDPNYGQLKVSVFNARSPDVPVPNIRIQVGEREASGTGAVVFNQLPPGSYTVAAEAGEFCGERGTATVQKGETTELALRLSPFLLEGERLRLILNWGENPRDLDAHVLLSESSEPLAKDHIYYSNKVGTLRDGGTWGVLDVDWQRSESFETITVFDRADGVYQYYVHLYAGTGTIGGSGAKVELFTEGCERREVAVPSACQDRWWYVADMRVAEEEVHLVERNQCQAEQPYRWDLLRKLLETIAGEG